MKLVTDEPDRRALWTLNIKLTPKLFYGTLIIVLSVWILQSFLQALLAACVTAIAELAALQTVRPSAVAHRAQRDFSDLHVRDGRIFAGRSS